MSRFVSAWLPTPGGDPAKDALLRGTAATPPLVIVAVLVAGAVLARRPGRVGLGGTLAAGVVGLLFLAGSTFNLPNDLEAARAANLPVEVTYGLAGYTIAFSVVLLAQVAAALGTTSGRPLRTGPA